MKIYLPVVESVDVVPRPSVDGVFLMITPSRLSPMMLTYDDTLVLYVVPRLYVPFGTKMYARLLEEAWLLAEEIAESSEEALPAVTTI